MEGIEYKIDKNNSLYYFPMVNRLSLNLSNIDVKPKFCDTSVVKLRIEISHACNGRCKYCLVFGNHAENFDVLNIKTFWEKVKKYEWFKNIKTIFIIGGEPLLFYDEICFILDNFSGRVSFSTNGTLLTEKMAERFSKSNVSVYISLDGPKFEDNKNRVYKDGSYMYPDIIKGINLLKKHGVKFGIFMVAEKRTIHNAYDMICEMDKKFSPTRIGYSLPHWTPDYTDDLSDEFKSVLLQILKNKEKINAEIPQLSWRLNPLINGEVKKFSCALHTSQKTVLPNEEFVRCSKIDNSGDTLKSLITNEMLDQNSPVVLAKNPLNQCSKCIAVSNCGGGCPFDGMKRFGCLTDKRECKITPAVIENAIELIVNNLKKLDLKNIENNLLSSEIIKDLLWRSL